MLAKRWGVPSNCGWSIRQFNRYPNIFQFALKEANTDVTSSLFIDDSFSNVVSAENMGIVSHHYTGFDELVKFLEKISEFD